MIVAAQLRAQSTPPVSVGRKLGQSHSTQGLQQRRVEESKVLEEMFLKNLHLENLHLVEMNLREIDLHKKGAYAPQPVHEVHQSEVLRPKNRPAHASL